MKNFYYINQSQDNIIFCIDNKIPFIAHPENGRIEVFANKPRIECLKAAGIEIWCEHGV